MKHHAHGLNQVGMPNRVRQEVRHQTLRALGQTLLGNSRSVSGMRQYNAIP